MSFDEIFNSLTSFVSFPKYLKNSKSPFWKVFRGLFIIIFIKYKVIKSIKTNKTKEIIKIKFLRSFAGSKASD